MQTLVLFGITFVSAFIIVALLAGLAIFLSRRGKPNLQLLDIIPDLPEEEPVIEPAPSGATHDWIHNVVEAKELPPDLKIEYGDIKPKPGMSAEEKQALQIRRELAVALLEENIGKTSIAFRRGPKNGQVSIYFGKMETVYVNEDPDGYYKRTDKVDSRLNRIYTWHRSKK